MKGLFSRTKTIRELKAILRNLSTHCMKVHRKFSKLLGIYCSWSRMNKRELTKVIDWFLGNMSLGYILRCVCTYSENVNYLWIDTVVQNIAQDLRLKGFSKYLVKHVLSPFGYRNFTVEKIYHDPDFEDKYFDQYIYDENGIVLINEWEQNNRKIGNKSRSLLGWFLGILQDDDTWLVIEMSKNQSKNVQYKMGPKYLENAVTWYQSKQ